MVIGAATAEKAYFPGPGAYTEGKFPGKDVCLCPIFPACAPVHVLQAHPDQGSLRVQVASGGGTFPVAGARVEVYRRFGGQTHTFYRGLTDESGIVQGIALPALPAAWSQAPDTASISGTGYLVSVRHPLFVPQEDREVTVYARIESILPVMLEPVI